MLDTKKLSPTCTPSDSRKLSGCRFAVAAIMRSSVSCRKRSHRVKKFCRRNNPRFRVAQVLCEGGCAKWRCLSSTRIGKRLDAGCRDAFALEGLETQNGSKQEKQVCATSAYGESERKILIMNKAHLDLRDLNALSLSLCLFSNCCAERNA